MQSSFIALTMAVLAGCLDQPPSPSSPAVEDTVEQALEGQSCESVDTWVFSNKSRVAPIQPVSGEY